MNFHSPEIVIKRKNIIKEALSTLPWAWGGGEKEWERGEGGRQETDGQANREKLIQQNQTDFLKLLIIFFY